MNYAWIFLITVGMSALTYFALLMSLFTHGSIFPDNCWGWVIFVVGAIVSPLISYWSFQKEEEENELSQRQIKEDVKRDINKIENFKTTKECVGLSEKEKLLIDENSKQICFYKYGQSHVKYAYKDILKSEVKMDGETATSTSRGSQIGGALLGGILAGGVGAIIGGGSGKQVTKDTISKIKLEVTINDIKNPVQTIYFLSLTKSFSKNSFSKEIENANYCHNLISVIIKQADEQDSKMMVESKDKNLQNPLEYTSLTDELEKLVLLKQQGLLSDDEFSLAKKKIIR